MLFLAACDNAQNGNSDMHPLHINDLRYVRHASGVNQVLQRGTANVRQ